MDRIDSKKSAVSLSQENYMRLMLLINKNALSILRGMFTNKWKLINRTEWGNREDDGSDFISGYGKSVYKESQKIQKKILMSGNIAEWDLPLLIQAIKALDANGEEDLILLNNKTINRSKRNKYFDTLKDIRNKLAHSGTVEIGPEKFEEMWKSVSVVLLSFGLSKSELDAAKIAPLQEDKRSKHDKYINHENTEKSKQLKAKGNKIYGERNFFTAMELYSEAIQQTGIPSEDLAVLYSNRSIAYLQLHDFESAKEDAKGAIHLRPTWWKGYFRLGAAYKLTENYDKALKNFDLALFWKPPESDIAKVTEERDHCRLILGKLKRKEHLDPMSHEEAFNETDEKTKEGLKFSMNAKDLQESIKLHSQMGHPIGFCGEGHNYRIGRNVTQNYELAAKFYAKAALKGDAEGMYNLAQMTMEGKGVRLDIAEGIRLLKQAASQDISIDFMGMKVPNIGVMESEHKLGLCYDEGVGVPQDFEKALYWYTRAVKHGSNASANNIAIMYNIGKGVFPNLDTTIQYWKLAASRKLVRAMENLALTYLQMADNKNARNWFLFGVKSGSLELKTLENEFKLLIGDSEMKKSFKEDEFELELLEEVNNGPLKHLIVHDLPSYNIPNLEKDFSMQTQCDESTTSRKLNGLSDPYRTFIIQSHRQCAKTMMKLGQMFTFEAIPAKLKPKSPLDLIGLKPIYFQDMDTAKDRIYEGFVIKLSLIEDAVLRKSASIAQIAEDDNGDAQRLYIYNFPQNKETQETLGFGCKISIVNPYFRLTLDGKPAIRVDDTSLLFLHSNLTDKTRCRYCGKEKNTVKCRKCKRCFYCSKQCLTLDETVLNHELVCLKHL